MLHPPEGFATIKDVGKAILPSTKQQLPHPKVPVFTGWTAVKTVTKCKKAEYSINNSGCLSNSWKQVGRTTVRSKQERWCTVYAQFSAQSVLRCLYGENEVEFSCYSTTKVRISTKYKVFLVLAMFSEQNRYKKAEIYFYVRFAIFL